MRAKITEIISQLENKEWDWVIIQNFLIRKEIIELIKIYDGSDSGAEISIKTRTGGMQVIKIPYD